MAGNALIKKVGFSASRCIADILHGKVSPHQVVVISASTRAPTREHWIEVLTDYHHLGEFHGHQLDKVIETGTDLWDSGKIHQPRVVGETAFRFKSPYVWLDLVHTKEDRDSSPVLAQAWANLNLLEILSTGTDTGIDTLD